MFHRIHIVLCFVGTVIPLALDALACGRRTTALTAAEQANNEKAAEAHRKAVQARNIRAIDKVLPKSDVAARDRMKTRELRMRAAAFSAAGKLDEADGVLREAWKALGHPEMFVFVARVHC